MQFSAVSFEVQCSVFVCSAMQCNLGSVQLSELYSFLFLCHLLGQGSFTSIGLWQF